MSAEQKIDDEYSVMHNIFHNPQEAKEEAAKVTADRVNDVRLSF